MKKLLLVLSLFSIIPFNCYGVGERITEMDNQTVISSDDLLVGVDVSDTDTAHPNGKTKNITWTQVFTYLNSVFGSTSQIPPAGAKIYGLTDSGIPGWVDSDEFVTTTVVYPAPTDCIGTYIVGTGGRNLTRSSPNPIDPLSFEADGSYNCMYNSFFGSESGDANTSGNLNLFAGWQAGRHNTIGTQNVFIGARAGDANIQGYHNTYIGVGAGQDLIDGVNNVIIGTDAALSSTQGSWNTIVGSQAGGNRGNYNTLLGFNVGDQNTGDYNILIGSNAGGFTSNTSGNYNVYIGRNSRSLTGTTDNSVAIGYDAVSTASNQIMLGGALINQTIVHGRLAINQDTTNSSARVHVTDINSGNGGTAILLNNKDANYNLGDVQGQIVFNGSAGSSLSQQFSKTSLQSVKSAADGTGATDFVVKVQSSANDYERFRVKSTGAISINSTITPIGTTGNQTINKPSGRVNIAAGASSITITNNLVSSSSIILANCATNDTSAIVKNVIPGAGSFIVNLSNSATAETAINWLVFN